jgi:hypothetical protein
MDPDQSAPASKFTSRFANKFANKAERTKFNCSIKILSSDYCNRIPLAQNRVQLWQYNRR